MKGDLTASPELTEIVEKFAQSKPDFEGTFKKAFSKLCDLGQNGDGLEDIEHFILDDPNFKLNYPHLN